MFCDACGTRIPPRRGHWVAGTRVFYARCAEGVEAHRVAFPGCAADPHTITDHDGVVLATFAGAVHLQSR